MRYAVEKCEDFGRKWKGCVLCSGKSVFVMVYSEKNDFKRYTYVLLKAMCYALE